MNLTSKVIKTDDIFEEITKDVEKRFHALSYELEISLSKGKNKIVLGLIKDELGGKIIKELVGLKAKTYSYLTMTTTKVKRRKVQKVCHKKKT